MSLIFKKVSKTLNFEQNKPENINVLHLCNYSVNDYIGYYEIEKKHSLTDLPKKYNWGSVSFDPGFLDVCDWNKLLEEMNNSDIKNLKIKKSLADESFFKEGVIFEYGCNNEEKLEFINNLKKLVSVVPVENSAFDDFLEVLIYSNKLVDYTGFLEEMYKLVDNNLEYNQIKMFFYLIRIKALKEISHWSNFSTEFEEKTRQWIKRFTKDNFKKDCHEFYPILIQVSQLHRDKLKRDFKNIKEFNNTLYSAVSILNRYMAIVEHRYLEMDSDEFETAKELVDTIIRYNFEIITGILNYPDIKHKKQYLREQIQDLIKTFNSSSFFEFRHSEYSESQLYVEKADFLKNAEEEIKNRIINIMYDIMYFIDDGTIEKNYFDLAYEIYSFYEGTILNNDNFWDPTHDSPKVPLHNGSYTPIEKSREFRMILLFKKYLDDKNVLNNISRIPNWLNLEWDVENTLKRLDKCFTGKFINCFENIELENFKKDFKEKISELKTKNEKDRKNKILKAGIYEKLVDNFKKEIEKGWKGSDLFRKILKSDYIEKLMETPKIPKEQGYYKLFPKEHFIDLKPFNEMPPVAGSSTLGMNLARNKTKQILKKILENLNVENIYYYSTNADLKSKFENIIVGDRNYFVFGEDLYKKGFEFDMGEIRDSYVEINGKEIGGYEDFYEVLYDDVLLVEEGALKLIQYNAWDDTKKEDLHVSVKPFDDGKDKEEINDIIVKNDKWTEEELKMHVKVRICERYEVNNINSDKIWLFKKN
ncbi:hypothetical protein [Methanococcus maripaludis]|uniref:Putative nuclease with TOPRIM domain n=1 Tax=Methanococcus maripaludis TaxID=39152 RepID=A0A7J9PMT2_METMI|nr:hypothetical protein [Methanococcus maripaludis]MBA2864401.1 putative nuclease with TOPRIM domain [Methanococcus maripaludis]